MKTTDMFEEEFDVQVNQINSREYEILARINKDEAVAVASEFIRFDIGFYTEDDSDAIYITVDSFEKYLNRF